MNGLQFRDHYPHSTLGDMDLGSPTAGQDWCWDSNSVPQASNPVGCFPRSTSLNNIWAGQSEGPTLTPGDWRKIPAGTDGKARALLPRDASKAPHQSLHLEHDEDISTPLMKTIQLLLDSRSTRFSKALTELNPCFSGLCLLWEASLQCGHSPFAHPIRELTTPDHQRDLLFLYSLIFSCISNTLQAWECLRTKTSVIFCAIVADNFCWMNEWVQIKWIFI